MKSYMIPMTSEDIKEYKRNAINILKDKTQYATAKAVEIAFDKLIQKKPIPHKVKVDKILIGNGYWCKGTTVYICPNCGEFTTKLYKHCSDCGQALDWSDT